VIGILVGAMPGLGSSVGAALILPFVFQLEPITGIAMLAAAYTGAEYGGSISAIAINTPGTPAAVATTFDGYKLTENGLPGKALGASIIASTSGGFISTIFLIIASIPLAAFALRFGPPEYFFLGVFGLTLVANLSGENILKGCVAAIIGLIIKTVGVDPFTGHPRFIFGNFELLDGIGFVPALIGLFAASEAFIMMERPFKSIVQKSFGKIARDLPSLQEIKGLIRVILQSAFIGGIVGAIPGAGATIGSLIAYNEAKRFSKHPEKFGTGILEGVAAPEAANNAVVGGALIPLLALGIPGSATTAIILAGFIFHGIMPGPELFQKNPIFVYTLFASLFIANIFMLALGLSLIRVWVRVIATPPNILAPLILIISIVGSYSVANSLFDAWVMFLFGVLGYIFRKFKFPLAPIVLAMVLGFMVEVNFRRSLLLSDGNYFIFFTRPISIVLIVLSILSIATPFYLQRKTAQKKTLKAENNKGETS